ncbi:uncharacterized protein VTP21DRAFT_9967 [Calcarisporiella thermophila]|uniref:uncharacterized protein n=1 Tax=Calcarisporiella thermophila TaxID=911321 RepID=UPI0037438E12
MLNTLRPPIEYMSANQQNNGQSRTPIGAGSGMVPVGMQSLGGFDGGGAVLRLMSYSEKMTPPPNENSTDYWKGFVESFYAENGVMRLALFDTDRKELRNFDLPAPFLHRFYHMLYDMGGVASIQLVFESTQEFLQAPNSRMVVCPHASMIYHYQNGVKVINVGRLRCVFDPKIKYFEFITQHHEEYLPRSMLKQLQEDGSLYEDKASEKARRNSKSQKGLAINGGEILIPPRTVTSFGLPEQTMRVLEMFEGMWMLRDLMQMCHSQNSSPTESLHLFTQNVTSAPFTNPPMTATEQVPGVTTLHHGLPSPATQTSQYPSTPPNSQKLTDSTTSSHPTSTLQQWL